jgi:hypothetical protein
LVADICSASASGFGLWVASAEPHSLPTPKKRGPGSPAVAPGASAIRRQPATRTPRTAPLGCLPRLPSPATPSAGLAFRPRAARRLLAAAPPGASCRTRHRASSHVSAPGSRLCRGEEQRIHRSVGPCSRRRVLPARGAPALSARRHRRRLQRGARVVLGRALTPGCSRAQGHWAGPLCTGRSVPAPPLPPRSLFSTAYAAAVRLPPTLRKELPGPSARDLSEPFLQFIRSVRCGCSPSMPAN